MNYYSQLNEVELDNIDTIIATSDDICLAGIEAIRTEIGTAYTGIFRFIDMPGVIVRVDITDYNCW